MLDVLHQFFGWVCGQNPSHTWAPGGEVLPCCQRCTGVYVGAFVATLLELAWRPAPTPHRLWLNGAFLLFMIPSAFYWIPQNPELRCASGIFFGFGLVAFLRLTLAWPKSKTVSGVENKNSRLHLAVFTATLLATLVLTPLIAEHGNKLAADWLALLTAGGALALGALMLANFFCALRWLFAWWFKRPTRAVA